MKKSNDSLRNKLQRNLYVALIVVLSLAALLWWQNEQNNISNQMFKNGTAALLGSLCFLDGLFSILSGITTKGVRIDRSPKWFYFDVILSFSLSFVLMSNVIRKLV